MTMPRVFLEKAPSGSAVVVQGEAARRLLRVLRLKKGDEFVLFGWGAVEARARVSATAENLVEATVEQILRRDPPKPEITIIGAIAKHRQMEAVIENAAMMGVRRLVPVMTDRSVARLNAKDSERKAARWNEIARNASALACVTPPMEVVPPAPLVDAVARARGTILLLYESGSILLSHWLAEEPQADKVTLLLGPEGGWTEAEANDLEARGAVPLLLGPWIMRPSVALVVAAALIYGKVQERGAGHAGDGNKERAAG
jgi:16S rRNA (uracil1498-N3)-methyltransferase